MSGIPIVDKVLVSGDTFFYTVLFPFDLTGYDFKFVASESRGGPKIMDFDENDPEVTVVAGDPDLVQNSVELRLSASQTEEYEFDCLQYYFQFLSPSDIVVKTFATGKIRRIDRGV